MDWFYSGIIGLALGWFIRGILEYYGERAKQQSFPQGRPATLAEVSSLGSPSNRVYAVVNAQDYEVRCYSLTSIGPLFRETNRNIAHAMLIAQTWLNPEQVSPRESDYDSNDITVVIGRAAAFGAEIVPLIPRN